jgi:predicted acylesterase/phospholipase RssA
MALRPPDRPQDSVPACVSRVAAALALAAVLAACSSVPRETFTAAEQEQAIVPGLPNVRVWADSETAAREAVRYSERPVKEITYLALSGGGGDGAFGAGLLNGWTRTGTRPEFTIVSGVSTGALIAPFAFLGPAYDDTLRAMYTEGYASALVESPSFINALFGSGAFDNNRLQVLGQRFVTPQVIAEVAREHRKGRRLLVITTNLDAQRPVLWDMGAIAASGAPGSDALFRSVLVASASVPGVFTPTMITAEANGRRFQEMHVDGGVMSNVFILPTDILAQRTRLALRGRANVYVIMNGKLAPSFTVVENRTPSIVGRAVSTLIQVHSRSTVQATASLMRRSGVGFHLAAVPAEMDEGKGIGFDSATMQRLFAFGYDQAVARTAWTPTPAASPARVVAAR